MLAHCVGSRFPYHCFLLSLSLSAVSVCAVDDLSQLSLTMEISNFSTLSWKHRMIRPNYGCRGNSFGAGDCINLQSSVTCCSERDKAVPFFSCRFDVKVPFRQLPRPQRYASCHVKRESSEGNPMLDEQTLERELKLAVEEENYLLAAKIRDNLKLLKEDDRAAVLSANSRFYDSFRNGDLVAMQKLWSRGENVCVVHPGVSGIIGYDLVMGSWEFVWADYDFPLKIETEDVKVHVSGDFGYVTCFEVFATKGSKWGRQFATNLFERIDGKWFICVHHASHVDL